MTMPKLGILETVSVLAVSGPQNIIAKQKYLLYIYIYIINDAFCEVKATTYEDSLEK